MSLSPIVLFVYNRLDHTKQTIESLQKNELANESELFIYSDAPKNETALEKVKEVRKYIKTITGFKKITIIERDKNWGLANSIIDGVTKIVNEYEKIIVMEDDLITSPFFLKYMNESLEFYKHHEKVWHISGWNYPLNVKSEKEVFLWRAMNCWGWATWKNRWNHYKKDIDWVMKVFSKKDIYNFNLDGTHNFWKQVIDNKNKKINTWAIFWYATIFKNKGLCLNPINSLVNNIGNDGSGTNCDKNENFNSILNNKKIQIFTNNIIEDTNIFDLIKKNYKVQNKNLILKIINKISRIILGKNLIK